MKILALDSTAVAASVALCEDEKLLALYTVNLGNTHSETLLPMVESVLKTADLTTGDIDLFAVSEGPGSFTGVRIGTATLKGLAFGKNKPCIGISTLEALAYNLIGFCGLAVPVMNARRSQVYTATFRVNNGSMERLTADRAISIAELEAELLSVTEPIYLSGDGCDITLGGFQTVKPQYTPAVLVPQNAYSVAMCALDHFGKGESVSDLTLVPTYLRPSQAERERNEKNQQI